MYRFSHYLGLAGLIVVALSTDAFSQGNSVGINTATPNPNAVLQLVSPDNNQGLLIPRLTTPQRLAMQLQASEKGLMVFDDTEGLFYYWNGSAWNKLLVSQNLQTLSLNGSLLKVSGANEVDLAGIDTDKQNLTFEGTNLSIERGNTVDLSSLITTSDADPENELQSLEFSSGVLKLTNDPTLAQVDLSNYDTDVTDDFDGDYNSLTNLPTLFSGDFGDLGNVPADLADGDDVDDADADATNEIQVISLSGSTLSLSSGGGSVSINDADADPSNEIQTLSLAGSNLTLSNGGGTVSINDADFSTTNEIQDVSISGNAVAISGGGTGFNLAAAAPSSGQVLKFNGTDWTSAADNVDDADNSTSNELQTLSLSGSDITLSNGGGTVSINDADFSTTNELQTLSLSGSDVTLSNGGGTVSINDADFSTTNELQTLSLSGSDVTLSNGGGTVSINDADFSTTNELQTLSLSGSDITLSNGGGTVSINDADFSTTNEIQNVSIAGNAVAISGGGTGFNLATAAPSSGQVLKFNGTDWTSAADNVDDADNSTSNELQTLSLSGSDITLSNGGGTVSINDADFSTTNELQTLSLSGSDVTLSNGGGTVSINDADFSTTNEIQDISTDATAGNITLSSGSTLTLNVDDADADATNEIQDISTDATAGNITLSSGSTLALNVDDADADPTNEIQDISTDATAGNITLSSGSTLALNVDDADADPTNEIQDISTDATAGNITLSSGSTLALNVDDADADPTNEIQDISTDATAGNITLSSGSTLALNVDDADADPTNEIQDISTDATAGNITLSSGSTLALNVDDADADPTNEIQDISTDATAGNITLSSGSTLTLNVDDADADPTNEIQDLDLTANTLTITNNGSATNIDLSPYQQDISILGNAVSISGGTGFNLTATSPNPMDVLKWNGTNWDTGTDNVNDADSNPSNELQTLNLTGTNLTISGFPLSPVDLSPIGVLPDQTGHTGEYLTTNGTGASWNALGALASQNSVTTGFITDGTITAADLNATVAGNGLSGGAGTPLAVNLSGTSGLQITTDQLEMPTLFPGGTTVGGGATTAINSLTFDAKGRFVSATTIIVLLSDKRLKKEITHLESSLEKLMRLNGYNYYLKSDSLNQELKTGVIAQEVEKVFPNLILNRPDGFLAVDYQGLIPILIEALKEEHARVSDLKTEVDEMKAQLSSNDERFKTLEAKLNLLIQSTTTAKASASSQE